MVISVRKHLWNDKSADDDRFKGSINLLVQSLLPPLKLSFEFSMSQWKFWLNFDFKNLYRNQCLPSISKYLMIDKSVTVLLQNSSSHHRDWFEIKNICFLVKINCIGFICQHVYTHKKCKFKFQRFVSALLCNVDGVCEGFTRFRPQLFYYVNF